MTGRIAVFIGQISQEYQVDLIKAIMCETKALQYQADVFSEFGSYGENFLHAAGERNIINLPFVEDYDGIIVAADTFGVSEMEKQLDIKLLAKVKGPVVSIRQEKDCFYSILIDNRAAMARMVEHFIKVHGLKRICFMKGRDDLKDALERYQGYLDIMDKYDLPVTEHMVFNGNYWRNMGAQAVDWFMAGPEKPEAIVCANDFMATSILAELKKRGIKVPEEIAVSGFDDIEECRYSTPGLCSVRMPLADLGKEAVDLIDRIVNGGKSPQIVKLPVEFAYRRSCGCGQDEASFWASALYTQKQYLHDVIIQNGYMNADYDNCDTMEDMINVAYQFSKQFSYRKMYICVCEKTDDNGEKLQESENYTEHMILQTVMDSEAGYETPNERFLRRDLLPDRYRDLQEQTYFFPLHHKNHCLGYLVLETDRVEELREFFHCWVIEFCSCMDKVFLYEENKNLQEFRKLSTMDDLTGLYNRRKLEQELSKKMVLVRNKRKVEFFIVSLDMDGLKTINDTYGHLEGDAALKAFAGVLQRSVGEKDLCCRVGGDEFTLLLSTGDEERVKEVLANVNREIEKYNEENRGPYPLSGSMGYAEFRNDEELTNCIKRADINMYANKMARKKGRR